MGLYISRSFPLAFAIPWCAFASFSPFSRSLARSLARSRSHSLLSALCGVRSVSLCTAPDTLRLCRVRASAVWSGIMTVRDPAGMTVSDTCQRGLCLP